MATANKKVITKVSRSTVVNLQLTEKEARALRDVFSHVALGCIEVDDMRAALDEAGIKYRPTRGFCDGTVHLITNQNDN